MLRDWQTGHEGACDHQHKRQVVDQPARFPVAEGVAKRVAKGYGIGCLRGHRKLELPHIGIIVEFEIAALERVYDVTCLFNKGFRNEYPDATNGYREE